MTASTSSRAEKKVPSDTRTSGRSYRVRASASTSAGGRLAAGVAPRKAWAVGGPRSSRVVEQLRVIVQDQRPVGRERVFYRWRIRRMLVSAAFRRSVNLPATRPRIDAGPPLLRARRERLRPRAGNAVGLAGDWKLTRVAQHDVGIGRAGRTQAYGRSEREVVDEYRARSDLSTISSVRRASAMGRRAGPWLAPLPGSEAWGSSPGGSPRRTPAGFRPRRAGCSFRPCDAGVRASAEGKSSELHARPRRQGRHRGPGGDDHPLTGSGQASAMVISGTACDA